MVPVSVLIVTKNEARNLPRCLAALEGFSEIIVIDSGSEDGTADLARTHGATVYPFAWNGQYPKKRQWCLENIRTRHEWIFFVDADEVVTSALKAEMHDLFRAPPREAGFFVRGDYMLRGRRLRFGVANRKLCLIDKHKMMFPVVDDLDIPGMGEIEGHYQPVLKPGYMQESLGALKNALLHYAYEDMRGWVFRHEKYARWEAGMNIKNAWPRDPVAWRQHIKRFLRHNPLRPQAMFLHSYILKGGILEGGAGLHMASSRFDYYRMIARLEKSLRGQRTAS